MPEHDEIKTDVLVAGGGIAGIDCALHLASAGLKVVLAEKEAVLGGRLNKITSFYNLDISPSKLLAEKVSSLASMANVEILLDRELKELTGEPGSFKALFEGGSGPKEILCSSVVIALGHKTAVPPAISESLPNDGRVISLSEFENRKEDIIKGLKREAGNKPVLFVGNYSSSYLPVFSCSMFNSALLLVQDYKLPAIISIPNAEVAKKGGDELYRKARDAGVLFFKTEDTPPLIKEENGEIIALIPDPYLEGEGITSPQVKVSCSLVVLLDVPFCSSDVESLFEKSRIKMSRSWSLQPDNPNLLTVGTNRRGIFVCGSCREAAELNEIERDAGDVAAEVLSLLRGGLKYSPDKIIVDKGKCTLCLTCYRVCPHGAITWERAAVISVTGCMECGTCTSECPNRAITLSGWSDEDIFGTIEVLL